MLPCGPGQRRAGNHVSGHGTIGNARGNGKVIHTKNVMSNRGILMSGFAAIFLGAAVVLLASAGDRGMSMILPPERPTPPSGVMATLPLSKTKTDESTPNPPGLTEGGAIPWRATRALEKGQAG
ncbi:unnamed protein product, partial [Ectocarpus fasciculatus]